MEDRTDTPANTDSPNKKTTSTPPNKPPSPDEIQKGLEDFVKKNFGGSVQFLTNTIRSEHGTTEQKEQAEATKPFDLKFDYKPKDIKKYLDQYIIKQNEAKKALAIAVCDHYNQVRDFHLNIDQAQDHEYSKQNVLMLGPTGVGKTYLVRQIAKLIGVPFVKADATRFTEMGYVGANADDLIHDLVGQAKGNLELAQYGIIYLDEADKLATPPNAQGKDVSGRGVQFSFLKLMEETEVDLRGNNDIRSQMQAFMEIQQKGKMDKRVINTRHILFIVSGAFTGLKEIIKRRLSHGSIGFNPMAPRFDNDDQIFKNVASEDLISFGFEPEFIGRLPIRVSCQILSVKDLFTILKDSKESIIRQYERAFKAYGIHVSFSDDALWRIAELAHKEKTGARALMTVCEKALREYKFELPSSGVRSFQVTKELINHPTEYLKTILKDKQSVKSQAFVKAILKFEKSFLKKHQLQIRFSENAIEAICKKVTALESDGKPTSVDAFCEELLQSYEHALELIRQNTGQTEFVLPETMVANPKEFLESWIRDSYQSKKSIDGETHHDGISTPR